MKNEIYSYWYKHPSQLINTPSMSLMINKEGIEAYGLYMHFADTLHIVGGYQKYDVNDICLMLGYTKKNIKAKLNRVLNDYNLFDFIEEDGIEMIGLQRLRDDVEALAKHKINGAKGGKKRAENYRNKQEEEQEEVKLGESYLNMSRGEQIKFVDFIKRKGELPEYRIKAYENAIKPRLSI
jgi:hypothetical protein